MNRLAVALTSISRELDELGARWALVGGLAVSIWAEPRLTRDVDVAVAVAGDHEAERLVRDLSTRGYRAVQLVEHEAVSRLATARLASPVAHPVVVDLLFASSGIEPEIIASAVRIGIFEGLQVPIATRAHLIAMKVLARDDRSRPQDFDDLVSLVRGAEPAEIEAARQALDLIAERGFGRARDLRAALAAVLPPGS
jgi:hypothetical protein